MAMAPAVHVSGGVQYLSGVAKFINDTKIDITERAMKRLARTVRWPTHEAGVTGYIGSTQSRRFKNLNQFFGYVAKNPDLYPRRWVFEPENVGNAEEMKSCIAFIYREAEIQQRKHYKTGRMMIRYLMLMKQKGKYPQVLHTPPFSDEIVFGTEMIVVNVAEHASSVEAHSYERAKTGGILYMAAEMAKRKWPELVIRFSYTNLDKLGLPLTHKYAVPYVRVGFRGNEMKSKLTRPGRNIRRRRVTMRARLPGGKNYAKRSARYARSTRDSLGRFNQRGYLNKMYGVKTNK